MTGGPVVPSEARDLLLTKPVDEQIPRSARNDERGDVSYSEFALAGESRRYRLFRPSGAARALLVVLHGCTQDADDVARGTRFDEAADREQLLVLYPEQSAAAHPQRCWRWYDPAQTARGPAEQGGGGEAALLIGMIEQVASREGADAGRVLLVGLSAGAAMAADLVAGWPERFAAVALHSGLPAFAAREVAGALAVMQQGAGDPDSLGAEAFRRMGPRARVVPAVVLQGAADHVVSIRNLDATARQWAVTNALAARAALPEPTTVSAPADIARREALAGRRWSLPDGTLLVEAWKLDGVGHAWSGGSADGTFTDPHGPDATALVLDFFARVTRMP